jgi:methyltransferase (TIGR00027 family)
VRSDLAATARATAGWRAIESERADALFHDPWAGALAGAEMMAQFANQPPELQRRGASYTVVRTRIFDDWLVSAQKCSQVVLLGAGFDTRAFRLPWPAGTHLWELDQPSVLGAKDAILAGELTAPGCTRHVVAADLAQNTWPRALLAAGFDRSVPTAWLIEGVLPYLEPHDVEALLQSVARLSAPGSLLAADVVSTELMAARNAYLCSGSRQLGSGSVLFRSGVDDPAALLARHGWRIQTLKRPGDPDADFGRWVWPSGMVGFSFVTAARSDAQAVDAGGC